ncbi:MAG: phosphotransferase family protein [Ilumatobacter sp.]
MTGEVLAVGRTSTVLDIGGGRVAKVLAAGVPDHWADVEATFTDEVRRSGAIAPAVYDVTTVDGRPAVVFEHIVGPSLWQVMLEQPDRTAELVELLVDVQDRIHRVGPCALVPALRDRLRAKVAEVDDVGDSDRAEASRLLDEQPAGSALLHGDLHPGNVLLGGDGPVVIDWFDATIGHPDADRARTALLLEPVGATDLRHLPGVTAALVAAISDRYRRLASPPEPGEAWSQLMALARLAERTDVDPSGLAARWERRGGADR